MALEPANAQVLHKDPGAGLPFVSSEVDPVHRTATRVAVVGVIAEWSLITGGNGEVSDDDVVDTGAADHPAVILAVEGGQQHGALLTLAAQVHAAAQHDVRRLVVRVSGAQVIRAGRQHDLVTRFGRVQGRPDGCCVVV